MRPSRPRQLATFGTLGCALVFGLLAGHRVQAGGPLIVGGTFGPPGQPFLWSTATEVQYRTDGGNLGLLSNSTANQRVAGMFQVWEDVPTAAIGFNRAGNLLSTGAFFDGDVNNATEFNAVEGSCGSGQQSPIIYDADGSLFQSLGLPLGVIGFAGPCALSSDGRIVSAVAALNGNFRDGAGPSFGEPELTDNEFDAVFIHEFGHFFGLDHSQININCLTGNTIPTECSDFSDDAFGLPTMFPFLINGLEETPGVHPARTLSTDDIAWVSRLYPSASFNSSFGTITGNILFPDGQTPTQGINVIARRVDNPRRFAVSVVSGYLFTGNPGQNVTADYLPCSPPSACPPSGFAGANPGSPFGSRNVALRGSYDLPGLPPGTHTVEIESVFCQTQPCFSGGSSVGPLDPPIHNPGEDEFFDSEESSTDPINVATPLAVSAGGLFNSINIILNRLTPPLLSTFDPFEPNDTIGTATPIFNGDRRTYSISPFQNDDFFAFEATLGAIASVNVFPVAFGDSLDPLIEILDFGGTRLQTCRNTEDDNVAPPVISDQTPSAFDDACINNNNRTDCCLFRESRLEFNPPFTGTFILRALDFRGDGRPDFTYGIILSGASNPLPKLTSMFPTSATAGDPGFLLVVNGSDFASGAVVRWNGMDRQSSLGVDLLLASIPASDLVAGGTAFVTVFNPMPGGGTSNALPFTIIGNPIPAVSFLLPDAIPATTPTFNLTVNGTGFANGAVVRWNGVDRTTTFVSSTQLMASIPASDVAAVGTAQVRVFNPAPGGGISNPLTFTISLRNPVPTVTGLSPTGATGGSSGILIDVFGSNFVFNSTVRWDGALRSTTFVNRSQLQALIPATDLELVDVGAHPVTVVSPGPGGGISNPVSFSVQSAPNPLPMLASLMPNNQIAGSVRDTLTLTVNGANFVNGSVVRWNGMDRTTSFVNSNQLTAMFPASDLTAAGTAQVTVFTPAPGGGISSPLNFTINNLAPVLASLSPSSATAGAPAFTVTVIGSNFLPGSVVRWNGSNRPTTFIGSNQLRATIAASDIASVVPVSVTVLSTGPGGGPSNPLPFTIDAAMQSASLQQVAGSSALARDGQRGFSSSSSSTDRDTASGRAPSSAVGLALPIVAEPTPLIESAELHTGEASDEKVMLKIKGANFRPGATVLWNDRERPTRYVSATELEARVTPADRAPSGQVKVAVRNPSGRRSEPFSFTIKP